MELTGSRILWESLLREGVDVVFDQGAQVKVAPLLRGLVHRHLLEAADQLAGTL